MASAKTYFTFWHLQNRKWKKSSLLIDPTTCFIKDMKSLWLAKNGLQTFSFSFVYNEHILEDTATLAGCGFGEKSDSKIIIVIRQSNTVIEYDDLAKMEEDKIRLHSGEKWYQSRDFTMTIGDQIEEKPKGKSIKHQSEESEMVCKKQMLKIKKDLALLAQKIENAAKQNGEHWIVDVDEIGLHEVSHASELLDNLNLYCTQYLNSRLTCNCCISKIKQNIDEILRNYCKELQGNSIKPSCGGSYMWLKESKLEFNIGPPRNERLFLEHFPTLHISQPSSSFIKYFDLEDLLLMYNGLLQNVDFALCKGYCITSKHPLEYDGRYFDLDVPVLEIIEHGRLSKFNIILFKDEIHEIEKIKSDNTTESSKLDDNKEQSVDELVKFIDGDTSSEIKNKKNKHKKKNKNKPSVKNKVETTFERSEVDTSEKLVSKPPENLKDAKKEFCKEKFRQLDTKILNKDEKIKIIDKKIEQVRLNKEKLIEERARALKLLADEQCPFEKNIDDKKKEIKRNNEHTSHLENTNKEIGRDIHSDNEEMEKLERMKKDVESRIEQKLLLIAQEEQNLETQITMLNQLKVEPEIEVSKSIVKSKRNLDGCSLLTSSEEIMLKNLDSAILKKERELECPICLEVSQSPIFSCPESHLICAQCKPRIDQCPVCRKDYSDPPKRHRYAEKIVEEIVDLKEERKAIIGLQLESNNSYRDSSVQSFSSNGNGLIKENDIQIEMKLISLKKKFNELKVDKQCLCDDMEKTLQLYTDKLCVLQNNILAKKKDIDKNKEKIEASKMRNKELRKELVHDQKEFQKLEKVRRKLEDKNEKDFQVLNQEEELLLHEAHKLTNRETERDIEVDKLKNQLSSTNLNSSRCLDEKAQQKSREDILLDILDRRIAKKETELQCPICYKISTPPIFTCPDSHLVCAHCKLRISRCVECNIPFEEPPKRHRYAEKIVEEIKELRKEREVMIENMSHHSNV